MEDVIGGRSTDERFTHFLADWEAILTRRAEKAIAELSGINGVRGLILAGSLGRGAPWPLSDIDILPIYDEHEAEAARDEIKRRRLVLLQPWIAEGWWTGLDIGRLAFGCSEVSQVLMCAEPEFSVLLTDDRWYHALDKGFGGRALYDTNDLSRSLVAWFTAHRFDQEVVKIRLERDRQEITSAQRQLRECIAQQDFAGGTIAMRSAVKWVQTWLLERWGERDNSLGRLGTRFALLARARGQGDLVEALDALSDLDDASVVRRLEEAPDWVHERHDRSLRARWQVGEEVAPMQDARDTLRVGSLYAMRQVTSAPYPLWLAVSATAALLEIKAQALDRLVATVLTE